VDADKPTVNITVAGTTSGIPVPFTVTFNEDVTGFINTDVALSGTAGATTAVVTGGPAIYTVNVSGMTGSGTILMDIAADVAIDAVGNGNTAASQASTTWSSCTPTVTQITVSSATNPINYPATTSNISLARTLGSGSISTPEWSDDAGATWYNATTIPFTAPAQSNGSVSITGQAVEDNCGTTMAAFNTITQNYDTRTPYIVPGTASAIQQGTTNVKVEMPYLGNDSDTSATFTVKYDVDGVPQTDIGPVADDGVSPYSTTLGPFTEGQVIEVNVVYADTEAGFPGSGTANQGPFTVTIVTWVDNYLLHNSNRFACSEAGFFSNEAECIAGGGTWTYDRKWTVAGNGSEWGTSDANDHYGSILCATCHEKNGGNIKRITTGVTASKNSFPGEGETIVATVADPDTSTSDYGDDSDGRGSSGSQRICEVCHSQNSFHNYDTANNTPSPDPGHYNNKDCIACHGHEGGFRASCNACHGNPPVVDAVQSGDGLAVTPAPTGSATAGAHDLHANTAAIDCAVCHNGSTGGGATHATGNVTLAFIGLPDPAGSFGLSDGGIYSGQTGVNYDTTDADTTVPGANDGLMTCTNYCHGGGDISGATSSGALGGTGVVWNGSISDCNACHRGDATAMSNAAALGSHRTHAGSDDFNTNGDDRLSVKDVAAWAVDCVDCHGTTAGDLLSAGDAASHIDGNAHWNVATLNSATLANYSAAPSGDTTTLATVTAYSTCSNVACHWDTETPAWGDTTKSDTQVERCTLCHQKTGVTPGTGTSLADAAPSTGQHQLHVEDTNAVYVDDCNSCHGTNANTGEHSGHIDFQTTMADQMAGKWTAGTDTCATACHKDALWDGGTINWTDGVTDACTDCHGDTYSGNAGPTIVSDPFGTPGGEHLKTDNAGAGNTLPTTAANWKTRCNSCHNKHSGTILIPNPANADLGIAYVGTNHGGIKLLGSLGSNEADACWTCHDAASTRVTEWATNTYASTGSSAFNYGNLYTAVTGGSLTSDWTTGYWRSSRSQFAYKTAQIQSTHSVSSAGSSALDGGGADYAYSTVMTFMNLVWRPTTSRKASPTCAAAGWVTPTRRMARRGAAMLIRLTSRMWAEMMVRSLVILGVLCLGRPYCRMLSVDSGSIRTTSPRCRLQGLKESRLLTRTRPAVGSRLIPTTKPAVMRLPPRRPSPVSASSVTMAVRQAPPW
jgi:predicted CxxxxCH...CXXCH cytochrome family protein